MAYGNSDVAGKVGRHGPSSIAELGQRVTQMLDILPTRRKAAEVARKNPDTITAWSKGEQLSTFESLAELAAATGVSLDWMATGIGPMMRADLMLAAGNQVMVAECKTASVDEETLEIALQAVEEFLVARQLQLQPDKRAALVATLYSLSSEEESKGIASNPKTVARLFRLAVGG